MRVYVRKVFPHDVTHEVSVRSDIVEDFFHGKSSGMTFVGKRSNSRGHVVINSVTDPRFGGDYKSLLVDEGNINVNDVILMYEIEKDTYRLEVIKPNDKRYFELFVLFRGTERHVFLSTPSELKLAGI